MPYTPTTYVNDSSPFLNATNLNKAETAIQTAQAAAEAAQSTATAKYTKPGPGIPSSDLTTAVQAALTDSRTPTSHTHPATQISDSTTVGRNVLTAADQSAGRSAIGAGTYTVPGGGIPSSDLTSAVQTSLGKADTAVQPAGITELVVRRSGVAAQPYLIEEQTSLSTLSSGNVYAIGFRSEVNIPAADSFLLGIIDAMAGGTLFRVGLYTLETDASAALVARSSGNIADVSTTGFVNVPFSTTGGYPATYAITRGTLYMLAFIQVGGSTPPRLPRKDSAITAPPTSPLYGFRRSAFYGGQSDLPTTIGTGQVGTNQLFWGSVGDFL